MIRSTSSIVSGRRPSAALSSEEFFLFQVGLALRRAETDTRRKPRRITVDDRIRKAALAVLPFRLTADQKQVLKEIVTDLQRPQPMNRLLQGDVGSGKTIVALLAALVAMENGLQVAVMSPNRAPRGTAFLQSVAHPATVQGSSRCG